MAGRVSELEAVVFDAAVSTLTAGRTDELLDLDAKTLRRLEKELLRQAAIHDDGEAWEEPEHLVEWCLGDWLPNLGDDPSLEVLVHTYIYPEGARFDYHQSFSAYRLPSGATIYFEWGDEHTGILGFSAGNMDEEAVRRYPQVVIATTEFHVGDVLDEIDAHLSSFTREAVFDQEPPWMSQQELAEAAERRANLQHAIDETREEGDADADQLDDEQASLDATPPWFLRPLARYGIAASSPFDRAAAKTGTGLAPLNRPARLRGSRRSGGSETRPAYSAGAGSSVDFFFPDSQDQIAPSFDFERESSSPDRVRQRDDRYAHEVISPAPYTGILLSKALVDGPGSKYTFAQRHRLYRMGVRRFFRLDECRQPLATLGDCGAFNYVREEIPPYSVAEVADFYEECGFDYGISVDHVILGYIPDATDVVRPLRQPPQEWLDRQALTLEYAGEFLQHCRTTKAHFEPLGVAQGWSPSSYSHAVSFLQKIGYEYIALGGMVPLKTREIEACLRAVEHIRHPKTRLHLLGITRTELVRDYERYGVVSFDSTSPFRQAFKDDRDNYYTPHRKYVAVRVMQIDSNHRLKQRVLAGQLDQNLGRRLEQACLQALAAYDRDECAVDAPLEALAAYDSFLGEPDRQSEYWRTLRDQPWRSCACGICEEVGIQVVIFRGTERNKRRGFHNLFVFNHLLHKELTLA
jgi:hypothetical protein